MIEAAGQNLRPDFCVAAPTVDFWAESPETKSLLAESLLGEGKYLAGHYCARRGVCTLRLLPDAVEDNDAQIGPAAEGEID